MKKLCIYHSIYLTKILQINNEIQYICYPYPTISHLSNVYKEKHSHPHVIIIQ